MADDNRETREKEEIAVSLKGGADIVRNKPEFSLDGKYLTCCSGNVVKVLSVRSGECVHTLKGHKNRVTCVKLNPTNPNQLLTGSLDKTIIKWDYVDGLLVREYQLSHPILRIYTPDAEGTRIFAILKLTSNVNELVHFRIAKDHKVNVVKVCAVAGLPKHTSIGSQGGYVANIGKTRLMVYSIKSKGAKETLSYKYVEDKHHEVCLTSVECHPTEQCLVTGVSNGKILIWYNVLDPKKMVRTTLHWHSLSVESLSFTTEGSYLLSGGHENTLVKWQWNSHHKDFLPRLGSPIIDIACSRDNTHYALCHMENGIQVVSSNSKVVQIFQGLSQAHIGHKKLQSLHVGLHLDPKTRALVTNGRPGHLQFYDLQRDKQLSILDVTGQNYISSDSLQKLLAPTSVECIDFDATGDWLVTVERWDNQVMPAEIRLKFWVYVPDTKGYKLNTLVELPHQKQVTSVKFRPLGPTTSEKPMVVTVSKDKYFKLWALVDDTDIYRTNQCWSCDSLGYYRDKTPCAASFSEDGTLLAVAFDSTLTLWDPDPAAQKASFSFGNNKEEQNIRDVMFGGIESSHFLMVTTQNHLYIWNLLTCSVSWLLPFNNPILVGSVQMPNFAVLSGRDLKVFNPRSSDPVFSHSKVSSSNLMSGIFIPLHKQCGNTDKDSGSLSWQQKQQLFFMNVNQELLTLNYVTEDDEPQLMTKVMHQNVPQTPFSILFSEKRRKGFKDTEIKEVVSTMKGNFLKEMLNTPAHVMPPTTSLAMSFMDSLLIRSDKRAKSKDEEDEEEEDEDTMVTDKPESDSSESDMEVDEERDTATKKHPSKEAEKITSVDRSVIDTVELYEKIKAKSFKWL